MRFLIFSAAVTLALGITIAVAAPNPPMTIPEEFRACTADSDCILVDMLCSACCDYDSINTASKDAFSELHADYCDDHDSAVCECTAPDIEPACRENRCFPHNPFADENGNVSYE